eukprot:3162627-Lingulodinium_polyedra.AAC.1
MRSCPGDGGRDAAAADVLGLEECGFCVEQRSREGGQEPLTSVLLRNLPAEFPREELQRLLESRGFGGAYAS